MNLYDAKNYSSFERNVITLLEKIDESLKKMLTEDIVHEVK